MTTTVKIVPEGHDINVTALAIDDFGNKARGLTSLVKAGEKGDVLFYVHSGTALEIEEVHARQLPPSKSAHYMMQHFAFAHLPQHLQKVSRPFGELAALLDSTLPDNPEKTAGLRKLLEAKDCAVRALLFKA